MIWCKIINKTNTPLALNWIPGGISIPVGSAAVLEYDPFTLMDRHGSVFHSAIAIMDAGLVEVQYCAQPPAKTIDSITATPAEEPVKKAEEKELPKQRESVFETDTEKGSQLDFEVSTPVTKPVAKRDDIEPVAVSIPQVKAEETASEAPVEEAPAETTKRSKRGSKKI